MNEKVFNVDQVIADNIPTGDNRCSFDATILENVIRKIIEDKLGDPNAAMAETDFSDNIKPCPTFVVVTSAANAEGPAVLFRSYSCEGRNANKCQAARCTSTAPTFFMSMFVDVPAPP